MGRHSPPADVLDEQEWGVAYGWSTGVHEVATLFALTQNPCQKWEALGYGKAVLLYQRTQHVLQAARLLPAHRRLPHQAFLSGLWWKLLSLQPLRLLACLPVLGCLRPAEQADPPHFTVNGFSAGSYTGAVIALAIRCLWPASQITARLGAITQAFSLFGCYLRQGYRSLADEHEGFYAAQIQQCWRYWQTQLPAEDIQRLLVLLRQDNTPTQRAGRFKHLFKQKAIARLLEASHRHLTNRIYQNGWALGPSIEFLVGLADLPTAQVGGTQSCDGR